MCLCHLMKGCSVIFWFPALTTNLNNSLICFSFFLSKFWALFASTAVPKSGNQNNSVIVSLYLPSLTRGSRITMSLFSLEVPSLSEQLKPACVLHLFQSCAIKQTHRPAAVRYHLRSHMLCTNWARLLQQHNVKHIFLFFFCRASL